MACLYRKMNYMFQQDSPDPTRKHEHRIDLRDIKNTGLEYYYPYIIEAAQEGIWVLDTRGGTMYANQRMALLLGTTIEDVLQKTLHDFLFEDDSVNTFHPTDFNAPSSNGPHECRYRQASGLERWVRVNSSQVKDQQGNPVGVVAMHTDITDRKKTETALQLSRENMGLIIDSVKDYAIMMVDKDRHVLSWNAGAELIFGFAAHEITGRLMDELFTPEDRSNHVPETELLLALKVGHSYDDRWHIRKDGSRFFASGVMTRLNQDGESTKFIKIARDWTERKNMEETLKKADRHKNEFLATLAHELRNPLASILSGMEVLKQEKNYAYTVKTRDIIERQIHQMIHLVNDLLDISRISLGKIKISKQPVNLIEAVHMALETARPVIEGYKHAMSISLPSGPIIVNADLTRLSQIFLNLLVNSAKYTPPAGKITFNVQRKNGEVVIQLKDNGMGIPQDMLSSIFEMFEQIQDRSEYPQAGLGIGLSVVKQLVEMHNGQVHAYSEGANKGSEFIVTLPMHEKQELPYKPDKAPGSAAGSDAAPGSKKILLVDDNTDAADMMEILLRKKGYTIQKAYDGRSGINTAITFDPDIVLLDLGLPDLNGYEVLKVLKEKLGNRFYLAISGWGQEEDLNRSKEAGFDHHLVKPVDIQSLLEIISQGKLTPGAPR
jgi:PAS domain S-box-containing protein